MTLMLSSWSLVPQSPNIIVPRQRLLTETPVRPSGRSSITVLPSCGVLRSARQEPDRDRGGLGAGDGSDDRRSVPVVLGVVGLVDVAVAVRGASAKVSADAVASAWSAGWCSRRPPCSSRAPLTTAPAASRAADIRPRLSAPFNPRTQHEQPRDGSHSPEPPLSGSAGAA